MKLAIQKHFKDFLRILLLLVVSIGVAGYILSKERLRFPLISSSPYTIDAAFSTTQSVTPGQGQQVTISGVKVGEIGSVTLKNGVAVATMQIDDKYKKIIHTNATALLRERTGLKDMLIELNPGNNSAPLAKPGWTMPVANTNPDVDVDEILSSLDSDTRSYLALLVNGAGQGLSGHGGDELAQVLERFEPTHRDLARLNGAIAVRGRSLQQLVNSLQRLNTALKTKQSQIVQLVDSSAVVFRAFASQDKNISRALVDLPGTLQQTTQTLAKVQTFAALLGPTSANLLPAARDLPAANRALKALAVPNSADGYQGGTTIVRDQVRPFVRASRPLVRNLRPAAINLAKATPNLTKTFTVINHLANMLGYNPGDTEHGYLWWLAWLDHNVRTLFSVQDANGDFRPLFLQASCATYTQLINSLNGTAGGLGSEFENLLNITPILTSAGVCPTQAAADAKDYKAYQAQQQGRQARVTTPSGGTTTTLAPFDPALPAK